MKEFDAIEAGIATARQVVQSLLNNNDTNTLEFQNLFKKWNVIDVINEFEKVLKKIEDKCKLIKEKIERNFIKLYFFGKMSSGKSRIINGIIRQDLFLSGPENTTSRFVHIEKSVDDFFTIVQEGKEDNRYGDFLQAREKIDELSTNNKKNKNEIKEPKGDNILSTESEENNFKSDKFIKVFVPIDENNKIMKENIELVDSPGSGFKNKITEYIKEYAKDADIFVFVLMHDITEDDKKFFEFQTENSTKPDIFVLINKWDDTDCNRPANIKESEHHLLSKCDHLIMKMSDNSAKTIRDRTYFISANEVFDIRINNNKEYLNNEKKKRRFEEFEKFESKIAEYVQSPKMHKYKRYSQELKSIKKELSNEFRTLCTNILNTLSSYSIKIINENIKKCKRHIKEIEKKCRKTEKKCIENIKCSVTKMMNTINIDNSDEIKENIKKHYSSIDEDIDKLYMDLDEKVKFIKDIYITANNQDDQINESDDNSESGNDESENSESENSDINNADRISTVSSLGEKNFQIQTDMQYTTFPKSKTAVRVLSFIPVIGAIATNILLSRIDDADDHHLNKTSFKELEKEIHADDEERIRNVKKNIEKIKEHFILEINEILRRIKTEKDCAVFLFEIFTKPDSIVNILFKDI